MAHTTVRISESTRALLRTLAEAEDSPMQAVLARALECYRRQRFLERTNDAYAEVQKDPRAWAEVERERDIWDRALADGLPPVKTPPSRAKRRVRRSPRS